MMHDALNTAEPTMGAIVAQTLGGPEVLRAATITRPTAGPTEMLVRVTAAGVHPADRKNRRSGNLVPPPQTPAWDVAGVVEALVASRTVPNDRRHPFRRRSIVDL